MVNKNVYKTDEATNELENGSVIIKERDVTISLARFEELIRAEQKLVLLCRSIYESDDYEAKRNEIIMQYQGNSNPFVDSPDLAEYLWGSKAGMPYATDGPGGSDDSPLRPSYRISDPRINLHSPYIPADASWKVDDTDVSEPYLSPSELGTGTHRLDYSSSTRKGTMLIEITE